MEQPFKKTYSILWVFVLSSFISLTHFHCGSPEQKGKDLVQREADLQRKVDSLLLVEQTLQAREEALMAREKALDSTRQKDSGQLVNMALTGRWNTKMTCTETTCTGTVVGDTKTEQWDISYQETKLIASAMFNDGLVRVYTGFYTGNTVELVDDRTDSSQVTPTKMIVRLRIIDSLRMEGQREILRGSECRILYALQMEKQL